MDITVTAPSGLEGVVKRELYNLIGQEAKAINGKLTVKGDIKTVATLNLKMRTASRVYIQVGCFKATTFDELFDNLSKLDFENYVDKSSKLTVLSTLFESKLNSIQAVSSVSKKAICKRLENYYKSPITESGFNHKIEIVIRRDYATVYINTSGEPLHKRGYRKLVGEAPIKETVACSLLNLSVWKSGRILVDPFCGSGTILIEAGMMLKNIAPGINRDFDFLHFEKFDTSFFSDMVNECKSQIKKGLPVTLYGFDIEESQIKLSKEHAKRAGVSDVINFEVKNALDFYSDSSYGVIVTNPPYGERLLSRNQIVSLYKNFGKTFLNLDNWSAFIITPVSDTERLFGKKADKKRKIYNGQIECNYYSFLGKKPIKNI